jgi:TonB family protein
VVGEIVPDLAASPAVPVESLAPAAGMGGWVTAAKRRGVLVTSLVGGAAALVVVGVVLQNRSDREEARQPVAPVASYEAPFTVDQMPEFSTGSDSALEAALAAEAAEQAPPVDTSPSIQMPEAPVLTDLILPANLSVAPSYTDQPASPLPLPTRPTQPTEERNQPTVRAVTRAPQVTNQARVQEALERQYPVGLRQAQIGGRVEMTFSIDDRGEVQSFQIQQGSGIPELDQAALRVAETFEFSPALRGTEPVATSVALGITFAPRGTPATNAPARPNAAPAANQPVPAQFDVAPQVRNAPRVQQAMLSEYPIGLRDTGIGGKVEMWFYVNERGEVERFQVGQGSGNRDLDAAALRVAPVFQFSAARRGNQPIATWFSFGITFGGADPLER